MNHEPFSGETMKDRDARGDKLDRARHTSSSKRSTSPVMYIAVGALVGGFSGSWLLLKYYSVGLLFPLVGAVGGALVFLLRHRSDRSGLPESKPRGSQQANTGRDEGQSGAECAARRRGDGPSVRPAGELGPFILAFVSLLIGPALTFVLCVWALGEPVGTPFFNATLRVGIFAGACVCIAILVSALRR